MNQTDDREVIHTFTVRVRMDPENPKRPTLDELENRISDGVQWMDGVHAVITRYDGSAVLEA